ncbi:MAG: hypothetical protein HC888_15380, partial [Candidatus Competibacteraceae bacterium]|nr:hypothetical protein [Candidatus Competibacteraceae bacterium]
MPGLSRSRVFKRFLLSNLIVLILPVLILFLMVYQTFIDAMLSQTSERNLGVLQQGVNAVDQITLQCSRMSYQIEQDPALAGDAVTASVLGAREAIRRLTDYSVLMLPLQEILLVHSGIDTVYSSSGTFRQDILTRHVYLFDDLPNNNFQEIIRRGGELEILHAQDAAPLPSGGQRLVALVMPLPQGNPDK